MSSRGGKDLSRRSQERLAKSEYQPRKKMFFSSTIKKCWHFCTIFRCKSHQFSYRTKICSLLRNTFNPWIKNATLTKMSKFFDGWRKNSKYFLMIWEKIVYIIRTKSAYFYSQFCIRLAALRSASQLQILLVKKICTFNPYNIIYYYREFYTQYFAL